ncbi:MULTISPECIES: hypothetical protein [Streptomyces]|uniref:hypothetical protein n=1 Tax=Streptomyces TaxID=1883 RepID=UPI002248822A|nr:hypothetical protein [Streptomyces sp. JHD 1]MCX2967655.1 hypothetical protein [Streptomyces sp. JHD 1]
MTGREKDQGEGREPLDEEAAWAQIVAGYGAEPPDPPGVWTKAGQGEGRAPGDGERAGDDDRTAAVDDGGAGGGPGGTAVDDGGPGDGDGGPGDGGEGRGPDGARGPASPEEARAEREPVEAREAPAEPGRRGEARADGGDGEDAPVRSFTVYSAGAGPRDWEPAPPSEDEDHFVPPEPPPLPRADTTTKFAWLAVLGGPALLLAAVLLQWDFTWWISTLGVGGFLGGFATLLTRLRDGDEDDWDDPGRGAVV